MVRDDETLNFDARVIAQGKAAVLVEIDEEEYWIPYSQIHDDSEICSQSERGEEGQIIISEWIAEQKGL
ncbi:MAG: hypothetical protein PVJ64_00380 [Gemmatimonadales bacterium]|jgi:hypothetical protein